MRGSRCAEVAPANAMISVIVPALNEEESLERAISSVRKSGAQHEIVVVDAGSSDRTVFIAEELGVRVIVSAIRQRAAQMNLGAEQSKGEVFLFLHADTILPRGALKLVEKVLRDRGTVGGGFARRFDSASLLLKWTCRLAELRNRVFGWFLGDQAIFVRRSAFRELDGFRGMSRFEDLDFSRRLRRVGRLATLCPPVISSARRFEQEGPFRRTLRDFLLTMRYLQGDPCATEMVSKTVKEHVR